MASEQQTQLDLAAPKVKAICDELELSNEVTQASIEQAERVDMEHPINRSGRVVAASSVYFQANLRDEKRTQKQVADVADVGYMSIRQCYWEIAEAEGIPIRRRNQETGKVEAEKPDGTLQKLREWFRP